MYDRGGYFFSIHLIRQLCRQLKPFQQRNNIIPLLRRKPRPFYRNAAGRHHPNTQAIAMWNFEVGGALDRVSDGVAKIQERAFPGNLARIGHHDPGFDRDIAPDKRDESVILRSELSTASYRPWRAASSGSECVECRVERWRRQTRKYRR